MLGDGSSKTESISSGKALLAREWYVVAASYDATSREVCLYQEPLVEYATIDSTATVHKESSLQAVAKNDAPLIMAAHYEATVEGRVVCGGHFNGKLDSPRLANRVLSRIEIEALKQGPDAERNGGGVGLLLRYLLGDGDGHLGERVARRDHQPACPRDEGSQLDG